MAKCNWCGKDPIIGVSVSGLCATCTHDPTALQLAGSLAKPTYDIDSDILPVYKSEEPIRAYKVADIVLSEYTSEQDAAKYLNGEYEVNEIPKAREAKFRPSARMSLNYTADDVAMCSQSKRNDPSHAKIPAVVCGCGFYAWKDIRMIDTYSNSAKLEVDLLGKVIECEYGYRAARQRVMRVDFSHKCAACGANATVLGLDYTMKVDPFCNKCAKDENLCKETITAEELSNMLNTEVMWQPIGPVNPKFWQSEKAMKLVPMWTVFLALFILSYTNVISNLTMFLGCFAVGIADIPYSKWLAGKNGPRAYFQIPKK
jgi:hypothetical protein